MIMLGDFNARIGNDVLRGVKQRFNEDVLNYNGELLVNVCASNELRSITPFSTTNHNSNIPSVTLEDSNQ